MLDQDFCEVLEYEVTKALSGSTDQCLQGFWCDGVLLPHSESEYSRKTINDKRQVTMTAFAGNTGQEIYKLTLHFGRKSLSYYTKSLSIIECIPKTEHSKWFNIDPTSKTIAVHLD